MERLQLRQAFLKQYDQAAKEDKVKFGTEQQIKDLIHAFHLTRQRCDAAVSDFEAPGEPLLRMDRRERDATQGGKWKYYLIDVEGVALHPKHFNQCARKRRRTLKQESISRAGISIAVFLALVHWDPGEFHVQLNCRLRVRQRYTHKVYGTTFTIPAISARLAQTARVLFRPIYKLRSC